MKKLLILASFTFLGSFAAMAQDKKFTVSEFYPGGQDSLVAYINRTKVYPVQARKNRIAGQAIVGFTLKEDGTVADLKLIKDVPAGCGPEAVRVIQSLKFNAPGYPIKADLPVNFKP